MKILLALLFSINIFACKCENASLKRSFESADFVFIGNIYDVNKTPSGFKTLDDYLSKVKIEKIYKANNYDGFYKDNATLFGSQLRSCDLIFDRKGRYLIFAYYEPDTGFLYSEQCLNTKKLTDFSAAELKNLEILSLSYNQKMKLEGLKPFNSDNIEIVIDEISYQPNRKINRLNYEIENLKPQSNKQKLIIVM